MEEQKTLKEEWEERQQEQVKKAQREVEEHIETEVNKLRDSIQQAVNSEKVGKVIQELANQLIQMYDNQLRMQIDIHHLATQHIQLTNLVLGIPEANQNYEKPKIEIVK